MRRGFDVNLLDREAHGICVVCDMKRSFAFDVQLAEEGYDGFVGRVMPRCAGCFHKGNFDGERNGSEQPERIE